MKEMKSMMKQVVFCTTAAIVAWGGFASSPLHEWDFEKVNGRQVQDVGPGTKKILYTDEVRSGHGVKGSDACWAGAGRKAQAVNIPIEASAFTVDLSFRLDDGVNPKEGNALWSYLWHSWKRGRILAMITKDGCLSVSFFRAGAKDGSTSAVDFQALSEPLKIAAGRWYKLRVASAADGVLTAYLDGALVLHKEKCPGIQGVRTQPPKDYPLFVLGRNEDYLDKPSAYLNGLIDDVAIYGEALGAPELAIAAEDYSGVAAPEYKSADDSAGAVLVLKNGKGETAPFAIKDKEGNGFNGIGLGGFMRAPEKFQKCRASAKVTVADDFVTVVVPCPVPEGEAVKRRKDTIWAGDAVEIFIRPDPSKAVDYHYAVNAAGLSYAGKVVDGTEVKGWTSGFKGVCKDDAKGFTVGFRIPRKEIFETMPKDGDVFTAQFIRSGPTSFGVASWKPAGAVFYDPVTFGRVVFGSCKGYFDRCVADVRAAAAKQFTTEKSKAAADAAVAAFAAAVAKHGGNPKAFAALETMQKNLDQTFLQIAMSGRTLVAFAPNDVWGNLIEPDSLTRPLERIRIRAAKDSRAYHAFAIANLSDNPFLGQVKVFDKGPEKYGFGKEFTKGVARHFTVHEGIEIKSGAGAPLWDPVAPLAMGTLLRIAPKASAMVWLELDTHGLAAGRHSAVLYVKKGNPGFETQKIPVEVDVVDAGLDSVRPDRTAYTYMTYAPQNRNFTEFLVRENFNMICLGAPGQDHLKIYNSYDKDGNLVPGDMAPLDRIIDAHLAAGLEKERVKLWFFFAFEGWRGPGNAGPRFGEKWNAALKALLEQMYAHVEEKYGITADRIILYPVDEPSGDADDEKTKLGVAYRAGKIIRGFGPQYRLMTNPLPGIPEDKWRVAMTRLSECYDIIEFYRPGLTPARVQFAKSLPIRDFWTYSIDGKESGCGVYRSDYWENMRDGFCGITTYWQLDEMAGGDGFDSRDSTNGSTSYADYGTVYTDRNMDGVVISRRQVASDMGYEDMRLIMALRAKAKGDAALSAKVEAIVKKAADARTMAAMDEGRAALLDLAK